MKDLRQSAKNFFTSYMQSSRTDVLIFSKEFTSDDRKVLHQMSQQFGLKSQSRGKGENRCLTVSRKGVSLGMQIQEMTDAGSYESDWCTVIPPGAEITWSERDGVST